MNISNCLYKSNEIYSEDIYKNKSLLLFEGGGGWLINRNESTTPAFGHPSFKSRGEFVKNNN
jgi:hypothetical protein